MEQNNSLSQAAEKEDIKIYWDEPMSRHTTMQVGGPVAMLAQPRDIRELVSLVYLAGKNNFRCMVMGNGSNLIFPDEGYKGLVIKTVPNYGGIYVDDDGVIRAEAGHGGGPERPHRFGICPGHSRYCGRCVVHERRGLRRRSGKSGAAYLLYGRKCQTAYAGASGSSVWLPHQPV